MRLIDADVLEQFFLDESKRLRAILNSPDCDRETTQYIKSFAPTVEWARKTVHHCSTIDAVPVVHGRWIEHYDKERELWYFDCPFCGDDYTAVTKHLQNYCPN